MSARPVITVLGGNGEQGGGLARAILADPTRSFRVRVVTRQPDGVAARALAALGAEVVQADLDDAASLAHALQGTYGVFGVTSDWEHRSTERELVQAGHIAQAARSAAARHVVWSTAAADALFPDLPTTCLRTSFYWDNLLHSGMGPRRGASGDLELVLPLGNEPLPGIAAADIGPCALGIFQRCSQFVGHTIGIAGEQLDGEQMAAALSSAVGEPVRYVPTPLAAYARLGFPGAEDLANRFRYQHHCNDAYCAERPVGRTRELHPDLMSFRQWLAQHGPRIPVGARPC